MRLCGWQDRGEGGCVTKRIEHLLDTIMSRSSVNNPFLITRKSGLHFTHGEFGKVWKKAVTTAGIEHRVPYCLRHSFAAWSLCINVDKNRLVSLMGHSTKEMVYENYGKYVEGLELDREKILQLFGEDFLNPDA